MPPTGGAAGLRPGPGGARRDRLPAAPDAVRPRGPGGAAGDHRRTGRRARRADRRAAGPALSRRRRDRPAAGRRLAGPEDDPGALGAVPGVPLPRGQDAEDEVPGQGGHGRPLTGCRRADWEQIGASGRGQRPACGRCRAPGDASAPDRQPRPGPAGRGRRRRPPLCASVRDCGGIVGGRRARADGHSTAGRPPTAPASLTHAGDHPCTA
jgi:hypothetical protein